MFHVRGTSSKYCLPGIVHYRFKSCPPVVGEVAQGVECEKENHARGSCSKFSTTDNGEVGGSNPPLTHILFRRFASIHRKQMDFIRACDMQGDYYEFCRCIEKNG